jgi:hypothetical protein
VVVVKAFVVVVTEDADKMTANVAAENRSLMIDLFVCCSYYCSQGTFVMWIFNMENW